MRRFWLVEVRRLHPGNIGRIGQNSDIFFLRVAIECRVTFYKYNSNYYKKYKKYQVNGSMYRDSRVIFVIHSFAPPSQFPSYSIDLIGVDENYLHVALEAGLRLPFKVGDPPPPRRRVFRDPNHTGRDIQIFLKMPHKYFEPSFVCPPLNLGGSFIQASRVLRLVYGGPTDLSLSNDSWGIPMSQTSSRRHSGRKHKGGCTEPTIPANPSYWFSAKPRLQENASFHWQY